MKFFLYLFTSKMIKIHYEDVQIIKKYKTTKKLIQQKMLCHMI